MGVTVRKALAHLLACQMTAASCSLSARGDKVNALREGSTPLASTIVGTSSTTGRRRGRPSGRPKVDAGNSELAIAEDAHIPGMSEEDGAAEEGSVAAVPVRSGARALVRFLRQVRLAVHVFKTANGVGRLNVSGAVKQLVCK
jgi:hypothetical protein